VSPADLALVLRRQGETVSLGGLAGLLSEAGVRIESVRVERGRAGSWSHWIALLVPTTPTTWTGCEGSGATIALALADACERVAS